MKKIFSSILLCVLIVSAAMCSLSLTACKKSETIIHSNTVEDVESAVSREVALIDGVNDFNDEQIKALAVVVRTRLKTEQLQTENSENNLESSKDIKDNSKANGAEQGISKLELGISDKEINLNKPNNSSDLNNTSESINSNNSNNSNSLNNSNNSNNSNNQDSTALNSSSGSNSNSKSSEIFERVSRLTTQTKNQVLSNGSDLANVCYSSHFDDGVWKKSIKKSQILDYMLSKGINLSNVSTLEYEKFDDNSLKSITIGGKSISYDELKSHFNLSSNKIISLKNNLSSIEIVGEYVKNPNCLYLNDLFNSKNTNYKEILSSYFFGYSLITM